MVNILIRGGFGDFLHCFAAVKSNANLFGSLDNIHIIYGASPPRKKKPKSLSIKRTESVKSFLDSQGVHNETMVLKRKKKLKRKLKKKLKKSHQVYTLPTTRWTFLDESWYKGEYKIDAYIPIQYQKVEDVDVVIQLHAGVIGERYLELDQIKFFVENNPNRAFSFIGEGEDHKGFSEWGTSYINKPLQEGIVDIVCSCNIFIGPAGFCHLLASFQGKKVYVRNYNVSSLYEHPRWNNIMFHSLGNIVLEKKEVVAEISLGELFDKISILRIKLKHIKDKNKLANIKCEYNHLMTIATPLSFADMEEYINKLENVNQILWDSENQIRIKEFKSEFDEDFIGLARTVYITNDMRFDIKSDINQRYSSHITEEKDYS